MAYSIKISYRVTLFRFEKLIIHPPLLFPTIYSRYTIHYHSIHCITCCFTDIDVLFIFLWKKKFFNNQVSYTRQQLIPSKGLLCNYETVSNCNGTFIYLYFYLKYFYTIISTASIYWKQINIKVSLMFFLCFYQLSPQNLNILPSLFA